MLNIHNVVKSENEAADTILQSFNAFNPKIALSPDQTLNNLEDFRNDKWSEDLTTKSPLGTYTCHFLESKSAESEAVNYSRSVGIEGNYGLFSASVQYNSSSKATRSSTSYYSSTNCMISQGTRHLKNNIQILDLLKDELVNALNGIKTLNDAEAFTKKYGTHVITSVNLGGLLAINTAIHCQTYSTLKSTSLAVSAKYGGAVGSLKLTAEAASEISNEKSFGTVSQYTRTIGGDPIAASQIELKDSKTVLDWAKTCKDDKVFGINESKEYWTLVEGSEAGNILCTYINLVVLAQSLKNPTIFSAIAPTVPFQENSAIATVSAGYKIIGGGAYVKKGTSSFLCGSYPQVNNQDQINGWVAASHDIAIPSSADDVLISYAMAVYDPLDLLDTRIEINTMNNQKQGPTIGNATVPADYALTGGGCSFNSSKSPNIKFMVNNYPEGQNWLVVMSDYERPTQDATVKIFALGLRPSAKLGGSIRLSKNVTKHTGAAPTSHGDMNVTLNDNLKIAGGGISINDVKRGNGNLAQQCYPGTNNQWSEYNSDLNGSYSEAVPTAYAINLTVDSKPLVLFATK